MKKVVILLLSLAVIGVLGVGCATDNNGNVKDIPLSRFKATLTSDEAIACILESNLRPFALSQGFKCDACTASYYLEVNPQDPFLGTPVWFVTCFESGNREVSWWVYDRPDHIVSFIGIDKH